MLISHFSLYMQCFTKPLIAATLLAVWLFSFGWMVQTTSRGLSSSQFNYRCHHCCQCGAPWGKIGRPSPAQSSGTPRAGSATGILSDGELELLLLQIAQDVSLPAWLHPALSRYHHLLLGHLLQSTHQSASGCIFSKDSLHYFLQHRLEYRPQFHIPKA